MLKLFIVYFNFIFIFASIIIDQKETAKIINDFNNLAENQETELNPKNSNGTDFSSDKNVGLGNWISPTPPFFNGILQMPLGQFCYISQTIEFGFCNSFFLRCKPLTTGYFYAIEKCPIGQIFTGGRCHEPIQECIHHRQTFQLTIETDQLIQETHFCVHGEGVYLWNNKPCSQQAIVCSSQHQGFSVICPSGSVIHPSTLQCVYSPQQCFGFHANSPYFIPFKSAFIDHYCNSIQEHFGQQDFKQTCRTWYVDCRDEVRSIINCESEMIFDIEHQRCRHVKPRDACFGNINCNGREWEKFALGECSRYFIHCDGRTPRKYICSEGFVFFNGLCVSRESESVRCPVCSEGDIQRSPFDKCHQYSICAHGKWSLRDCPLGQTFSLEHRACLVQSSCAVAVEKCSIGTSVKISCNEYMECVSDGYNGRYQRRSCPVFQSYDITHRQCIYNPSCNPYGNGCPDGFVIQTSDCISFYRCSHGKWSQERCDGSPWHQDGCKRCDGTSHGVTVKQWECIDGDRQHNPYDCKSFMKCIHGTWSIEKCPHSLSWDQVSLQCVQHSSCAYYTVADCEHNQRIPYFHENSAVGFFECFYGKWTLFNCQNGFIFDPFLNDCNSPFESRNHLSDQITYPISTKSASYERSFDVQSYHSAPAGHDYSAVKKRGCVPGSSVRDDYDCSRFYLCTQHGYILSSCKQGSAYNPVKKICDFSYDCDLSRCIDGQLRQGARCGEYTECVTGRWTHQKCPNNKPFVGGRCHSDLISCKKNFNWAPYCVTGKTIPVKSDCTLFLVCTDGYYQQRQCQYGSSFDPSVGHCSSKYNCPSGQRPPCFHGDVRPEPEDCAAFKVCMDGTWENRWCPVKHYFSVESRQCLPGECKKENPNIQEEKCIENGNEFGYRADPFNCRKFYQCAHGKWVQKDCPGKLFWNKEKTVCDHPENVLGCEQ